MIKKAIKILATVVVAIAAFAFAGTTEARAETLLSGNFSSLGQLDAQFDVYGDTPAVDGSLELLPEGETLVLSKRGDFDDFTLDAQYEITGNQSTPGNSEVGILLHAEKTGGEGVAEGLSGMLVGLEYVGDRMQCSVGWYFDGVFEPAGYWDAGWENGFAPRNLRIVVKESTVSIIIDNWQAFVQMDKFYQTGKVGIISKGVGLKIGSFAVSSAPDSIYPAVTREQWQGNDSINTGKAFTKGQKHSFEMTLPKQADIEKLTLYRRADAPSTQSVKVEIDGEDAGIWNAYGGDVAFDIPLEKAEGKEKLTFTVTMLDEEGMYNSDYYWLGYVSGGKEYIADSLDVGSAHDEAAHSFKCDPEVPAWDSFYKRFMSTSSVQIITAYPGIELKKVVAPAVTAPDAVLEKGTERVDLADLADVSYTSFDIETEYYLDGVKLEGSVAEISGGEGHTYTVKVKCLPYNTYSQLGAVAFNEISATGNITFSETETSVVTLNRDDIYDKIFGGWAGANWGIYAGLDTECVYNDQPSPETEIEWLLGDAYCTDDDTNVEYMFLHMMEVYGVNDISYDDFAEEFLFHCQNYVWCANLEARELMRSGVLPPMSGQKQYNSQWSAIDAQIESEIFGMTAPGNPVDAYKRSKWWVSAVGDGVAVENAAYYAMLCASAFYLEDVDELLRETNRLIMQLSGGDAIETVDCVNFVLDECEKIADSYRKGDEQWRQVRLALKNKYYTGNAVDARLNFASVIMALALGDGDFEETARIAVLAGWDNDCNAATACTIAGMISGWSGLPQNLKEQSGTYYYNSRRPGLTSDSFDGITRRIMVQGEKVLLSNGGSIENGVWTVPVQTLYTPASYASALTLEKAASDAAGSDGFKKIYDEKLAFSTGMAGENIGDAIEYSFEGSSVCVKAMLSAAGGEAEIFVDGISYGTRTFRADPADGASGLVRNCYGQTVARIRGLEEGGHTLKIVVTAPGVCVVESIAAEVSEEEFLGSITSETNLARQYFATPICSVMTPGPGAGGNPSLSVINDGLYFTDFNNLKQQYDTFLGYENGVEVPKEFEDYIGYTFSHEFTLSKIVFQEGGHWAGGGWFADGTLRVEIFTGGEWKSVGFEVSPAYPDGNQLGDFGAFGETYVFTIINPEKASGIRLIGTPGGYQKLISCAEMEVYKEEERI